jgi:hypothetical protein
MDRHLISCGDASRKGNVRAVIQAYLRRTGYPVAMPGRNPGKQKGRIGWPQGGPFRRREVDANHSIDALTVERRTYPAIASHDERILRETLRRGRGGDGRSI